MTPSFHFCHFLTVHPSLAEVSNVVKPNWVNPPAQTKVMRHVTFPVFSPLHQQIFPPLTPDQSCDPLAQSVNISKTDNASCLPCVSNANVFQLFKHQTEKIHE